MEQPKWEHDCEHCVFLGQYNQYDLYFHNRPTTIIARFGNDGPEYHSGLHMANYYPELAVAKERAIERGLLQG